MLACQGCSAQGTPPSRTISCVEEQYQIHIDVTDVAWLENKGASPLACLIGALQALRGGEGMGVVSIKELLEAGVHFRAPDEPLESKDEEVPLWRAQRHLYHRSSANGRRGWSRPMPSSVTPSPPGQTVLFVGTKRQAAEILQEEAVRANMFLRESALAGRHADELPDHPAQHRQDEKARGHAGRSQRSTG